MPRPRFSLTTLMIVMPVLGCVVLFGIGWNRLRITRGDCETVDCLATVLPAKELAKHFPKNVHNVRYSFRMYSGLYEFKFQLEEKAFIEWALELGWTQQELDANHKGGSMLLSISDEKQSTTFAFKNGYLLESKSPDGVTWRTIAYDQDNRTVMVQVWSPIPEIPKEVRHRASQR